jgi:serine/threonine-protein kinase
VSQGRNENRDLPPQPSGPKPEQPSPCNDIYDQPTTPLTQKQSPKDNVQQRETVFDSTPKAERGLDFQPPPGYDILEVIGRGGMGVVYKARQHKPSRIVALKVLLDGAHASEEGRKRFIQEAEAASALKHPGIVPIFELGEHEGKCFFTMEHVEGLDLHRYIQTANPTLKARLELFIQICEVVTFAHIHGLIHRDLKPQNIRVEANGNPRLLDFGLAKRLKMEPDDKQSIGTMSGAIMGTCMYMSPEQTRGATVGIDTRSDLYSLGVILYEMLTGALPYPIDMDDPVAAFQNIRDLEPKRPSLMLKALKGIWRRSCSRPWPRRRSDATSRWRTFLATQNTT